MNFSPTHKFHDCQPHAAVFPNVFSVSTVASYIVPDSRHQNIPFWEYHIFFFSFQLSVVMSTLYDINGNKRDISFHFFLFHSIPSFHLYQLFSLVFFRFVQRGVMFPKLRGGTKVLVKSICPFHQLYTNPPIELYNFSPFFLFLFLLACCSLLLTR